MYSSTIGNISKALLKFQSSVSKISRDSDNPFFKSKYASLEGILDAVDSHLIECGLVVLQLPQSSLRETEVTLKTVIIHAESGEYIESVFSMIPVKRDPQSIGSCITYMRRYALTSILKLNVDDDDDGNAASSVKQDKKKVEDSFSSSFYELKDMMTLSQSREEVLKVASMVTECNFSAEEKYQLKFICNNMLSKFGKGAS